MNIPTYLRTTKDEEEYYQEELNQTLQENLSNNGYVLPTITDANLRIDEVFEPNGSITTLDNLMPDGTMWYISDAQVVVVKVSGSLRQIDTSAYP